MSHQTIVKGNQLFFLNFAEEAQSTELQASSPLAWPYLGLELVLQNFFGKEIYERSSVRHLPRFILHSSLPGSLC